MAFSGDLQRNRHVRLVGVNPEAHIRWVLHKLASATNKTAVDLLPHDFARLYPDQVLG